MFYLIFSVRLIFRHTFGICDFKFVCICYLLSYSSFIDVTYYHIDRYSFAYSFFQDHCTNYYCKCYQCSNMYFFNDKYIILKVSIIT